MCVSVCVSVCVNVCVCVSPFLISFLTSNYKTRYQVKLQEKKGKFFFLKKILINYQNNSVCEFFPIIHLISLQKLQFQKIFFHFKSKF